MLKRATTDVNGAVDTLGFKLLLFSDVDQHSALLGQSVNVFRFDFGDSLPRFRGISQELFGMLRHFATVFLLAY